MQNWRRIFYFILLNIFISAATVWVVVTIMFKNQATQPIPIVPSLASQSEGQTGEILITQPAADPSPSTLQAVDVVADLLEIEGILGSGDLETEQILIKHIGEVEVSLMGWYLQDQDGHVYNFPALTMFQGGAVTIHTREGTSTVVELYWGLDKPIWESGEQAFLLDADGNTRATYTVP